MMHVTVINPPQNQILPSIFFYKNVIYYCKIRNLWLKLIRNTRWGDLSTCAYFWKEKEKRKWNKSTVPTCNEPLKTAEQITLALAWKDVAEWLNPLSLQPHVFPAGPELLPELCPHVSSLLSNSLNGGGGGWVRCTRRKKFQLCCLLHTNNFPAQLIS